MTTVVVLCDAPDSGRVLEELAETSPLSGSAVADLYAALLKDTVLAASRSGGELLVNYRDDDVEEAVRGVVAEAVDVDAARFEVQVGETFAGRAGNTATHLLQTEEVESVAVVRPEAAFLARTVLDEAAMKLRSSEVVLGPAPGGRVYAAAFGATIDYGNAWAAPAVETLTDRAIDAGLDVDFLSMAPYLETESDLADAVVQLRARRAAGAIVPPHFTEWVAASDLVVTADDGGPRLAR